MKKTVLWLAICTGCVIGYEGIVTQGDVAVPYLDVGGVPTICHGETKGVTMRSRYTPEECERMLAARLEKDFGPGVDKCVKHPLPPKRKAAYVSVAYNIGVPTFCKSTIAKKENAGDARGACDALLLYTKVRVNGELQVSRGLTRRREGERKLCLESLP